MKRQLLIADDDPVLRAVIREFLEHKGDFKIDEAANGVEAVELAHRLSPTVILMDIRMPKLDGISATRQIKVEGVGSKVVICSSYNTEAIIETAKEAGAIQVMAKPFDLSHLFDVISELCG